MKVILLQNIKGKGRKGDIIDVPDGYAQNALIPKGFAKAATRTELNRIEQSEKSLHIRAQKNKEHLLRIHRLMQGKTITINERLNEKGSLYHAVSLKEISDAIHDQIKITIPQELYVEKYAFKDSGEYKIELESDEERSSFHLKIDSK